MRVYKQDRIIEGIEDAELTNKMKEGCMIAYGTIYKKYYKRVYYRLLSLTSSNKERAEDLTSQVFEKVFKSIDKFDSTKPNALFSNWISLVSKNVFCDSIRATSFKVSKNSITICETLNDEDSSFQLKDNSKNIEELLSINDSNDLRKLKKALSELKESDRKILEMRFFENKSYNEIKEELGGTVVQKKVSLMRAIIKLKNKML